MAFGIDTFSTHLDLINWTDFKTWNKGAAPKFAGRNFLGGDFLWGHGEATNALAHPDPHHPENLDIEVELIAPIQAPNGDRQQEPGWRGWVFGQIDGQAIAERVRACIFSGELERERFVHVWLAVDPSKNFSVTYWAGWATAVNTFTWPELTGVWLTTTQVRPLRAAIYCRYNLQADGSLRRDERVNAVLVKGASPDATAHGFWADAPRPDLDVPNPVLDWKLFTLKETPLIWRISTDIRKPDGTTVVTPFSVDATNPSLFGQIYMLKTRRWQPSGDQVNVGFSNLDPITAAQINGCIVKTDYPAMDDSAGGAPPGYHVKSASVSFVGRYIKRNFIEAISLTRAEAERLSNANLPIFTAWEGRNVLARGEPAWPDTWPELDPDPKNSGKIGADYFDPHHHAGTQDGSQAFEFAGLTLRQPPHTPIFFAIDGDSGWNERPPRHVDPLAAGETTGTWIARYFQLIHDARAAWVAAMPHRPYLIGVYGNGRACRELYRLGIVDMFWQAMSPGWDESRPGNNQWPWAHANRWQYQGNKPYCGIGQSDPDGDWFDGGTWLLTDPLAQQLSDLEDQEARDTNLLLQELVPFWGALINP